MAHPDTSYDAVLYPSYTHPQTHPDRLAVIGSLFGLEPAAVDRCRVLELGCGNGSNLVPMAYCLPASQFIGLDLAARPVAMGNAMIRELGLTNIKLIQANLTELNQPATSQASPATGQFDYILAHGLYSWVPENVRRNLLAACHNLLTPQGIAFVSYNALPGGHLREMLREMMLFHVRGIDSPEERVRQATAFLGFLADAQETPDLYRVWMKAQLEGVLAHEPGHLFHDELAALNQSLYFTQFLEAARIHGLQYLGEADYFEMFDHSFNASTRQTLDQLAPNRILREQYLDFLKCRRFRQTLLCRQDLSVRGEPDSDKVARFLVSAQAQTVAEPDLRPGVKSKYRTPDNAQCETDLPIGKAALAVLGQLWPAPVPFRELLDQANLRLAQEKLAVQSEPGSSSCLAGFLLSLYSAGVVNFHTFRPPLTLTPAERPTASPVARWQARQGPVVTTLLHRAVKVEDEVGRALLQWLDGSQDRPALLEKVWLLLKSRNALVIPEGNEGLARTEVGQALEKNLHKLASLGLLACA